MQIVQRTPTCSNDNGAKVNYQIVTGNSPGKLSDKVNVLIADGWIPNGGIAVGSEFVTMDVTVDLYCQAMTKAAVQQESGHDKA
jgi:hypothetical protein